MSLSQAGTNARNAAPGESERERSHVGIPWFDFPQKQFFEVSNIFGMLRLTFEVRVSLLGFVPDLEMGNPSLSWLEPPQMGEAQPGHWQQRRVGRPWEMGRMIHGSRDMESWSRGVVVMSPKDFQRKDIKDIFKFHFFGFLNFSRLATSGSIV